MNFLYKNYTKLTNNINYIQSQSLIFFPPSFPPKFQHSYLANFGYLPKSHPEIGNLLSESQLTKAIKNLQHFGNLPETGLIDEPTAQLLRRPRCGMPDVRSASDDALIDNRLDNYRTRSKRYANTRIKWDRNDITWR